MGFTEKLSELRFFCCGRILTELAKDIVPQYLGVDPFEELIHVLPHLMNALYCVPVLNLQDLLILPSHG